MLDTMNKMHFRIIHILIFVALSVQVFPQMNKLDRKSDDSPGAVMSKIEEGFTTGEVDKFSKYFGSQTYASLSNGVSGYYSSNQFFYIMENYFSICKPISFRIINSNTDSDNPYAAGVYKYESKGIRGSAQVFISLKRFGSSWKISQITIK